MKEEEKLIREYFEFKDINQSEPIEVLPLTILDLLLEYRDTIRTEIIGNKGRGVPRMKNPPKPPSKQPYQKLILTFNSNLKT